MKFTEEEKPIVYKIASGCGVLLCAYLFVLMIALDEATWASDGYLFALLGVLGYFSLVFLGIVTFLRVEMKLPDGTLRRITVWEVLGYSIAGAVMSQVWQYVERSSGISESTLTIAATAIIIVTGILLYLRSRKVKAS